jgi:hypothetical protein
VRRVHHQLVAGHDREDGKEVVFDLVQRDRAALHAGPAVLAKHGQRAARRSRQRRAEQRLQEGLERGQQRAHLVVALHEAVAALQSHSAALQRHRRVLAMQLHLAAVHHGALEVAKPRRGGVLGLHGGVAHHRVQLLDGGPRHELQFGFGGHGAQRERRG